MKHLKYILLPISAFFLWGCTGEKQNTRTEMQTREIFLINESYPKDVCLSKELGDALQTEIGLTNIMMSSTDDSVNCAYFSRTSTSCVKFSFSKEYSEACVIAADRAEDKKGGQINGKDIADLMIGLLKK